MKYFFSLIIILICYLIGKGLSKQYLDRTKLLESIIGLIDYISTEIRYKSKSLMQILKTYDARNLTLKSIIASYISSLENQIKFDCLNESNINNSDVSHINQLFLLLGKSDVKSQLIELGHTRDIFKNLQQKADEDCKKYSSLFTKLGLVVGLAIAILIV